MLILPQISASFVRIGNANMPNKRKSSAREPRRRLTEREQSILDAKPSDEPDHARIIWRKQRWKLPRGKTTARVRTIRPWDC